MRFPAIPQTCQQRHQDQSVSLLHAPTLQGKYKDTAQLQNSMMGNQAYFNGCLWAEIRSLRI